MLKRPHDDGLPARESGPSAEDRLSDVKRYFSAFTGATAHRWPTRAYADLLAGPGRCYERGRPAHHFDGSPLLALKALPPFTHHLFVEPSRANAAALRQRVTSLGFAGADLVHEGHCNADDTIHRVRAFFKEPLGLLFVDTLALDTVRFSTLQRVTNGRQFDMIYSFHVQDATRNVGQAQQANESARLDVGFGSSDWAVAWDTHVRGLASRISVGNALTTFFQKQLGTLGYPFVEPLPMPRKNTRNTPLYGLVLASHSERAIKLWRGISNIESGQPRGGE